MYCMKCGSLMEPGANFCTACGARAFDSEAPEREFLGVYSSEGPIPEAKPRSEGFGRSAKRFAVMSLAVMLLVLVIASSFTPPAEDTPERSYTLGSITVYGDLYSDDIIVLDSPRATMTYTGEGGDVYWKYKTLSDTALVYDKMTGRYVSRGYDLYSGSSLTFTEPGNYEVALISDGKTLHLGRVVLDGTVTTNYEWKQVLDRKIYTYSFQFSYEFSDYYKYATMDNIVRHYNEYRDDSRFVVVDDTILSLEEALSDEYKRVRGSGASLNGHDYADYLLSFVQCNISYPTMVSPGPFKQYYLDNKNGVGDYFLNGVEEYWAFPMETLYLGMGDCEDTSFLTCALFSAAGYRSALISIPSHMLSAVSVDSLASNPSPSYYASAPLKLKDGTVMYCCETTYNGAVPVGYYNKVNYSAIMSVTTVDVVEPYERGQTY